MSQIRDCKWAYLPMETLARELPSRVLLALELARRGYAVVLGPRPLAHRAGASLPPGVILYKGLVDMGEQFAAGTKRGNTIVGVDEEGLIYPSADVYVDARIDRDAWQIISRFYTWGERQTHDIINRVGDDRSIIRVTGNPRVDILKSQAVSAGASHRGCRKYVLISSNFSLVNPLGVKDPMPQTARAMEKYPEFFAMYRSQSEELFQTVTDLVRRLGQSPDIPVVFRPHPEENGRYWEDLCRQFANVKVTMRDTAVAWIASAAAVVHNDCTTAVESFLMGVPPIVLGIQERAGLPSLPNSLSIPAEGPEQAIRIIRDILSDPARGTQVFTDKNRETLSFYVRNYEDDHYAFRAIADDIDTLPLEKHSFSASYVDHQVGAIDSWRYRRRILRSGTRGFSEQKFPGLDRSTMKNAMGSAKVFFTKSDRFRLMCIRRNIWVISCS